MTVTKKTEPEFTAEFFRGNRQRLREALQSDMPLVITANGQLQRGADSAFAFAQDASFWYLTGIQEPDITLVMTKNEEYLIVPRRSSSREAFDGAISHAELTKRAGVNEVYDNEAGWQRLEQLLKTTKKVATLPAPPSYIEQLGMYTNPARTVLINKMKTVAEVEVQEIAQELAHLRMVKQPPELAAIRQAIDITASTLQELTQPTNLARYRYEYELEADISRGFRQRGASGHAYDPIVAAGQQACTLHYVANGQPIKKDELVLLDVGAQYAMYAADITRTYSRQNPTKRQQAVYDAVLAVQDYAIKQVKAGMVLREYEQAIEQCLGEQLQQLGLIKHLEHEAIRRYYPHSTSHFLGLNVHDVGDYQSPLPAGAVITVEPGIYIPEEGIGIRIEDDVLLTEQGPEVLSDALPRKLYEGS